jgi:hypothetical protein
VAPDTDKHGDDLSSEVLPVKAFENPDREDERLVAYGFTRDRVTEWGIEDDVITEDDDLWTDALADIQQSETIPLDEDPGEEIVTDGRGTVEESFARLREFIKAGREAEALGQLDQLRKDLNYHPEDPVGSYLPADVERGEER